MAGNRTHSISEVCLHKNFKHTGDKGNASLRDEESRCRNRMPLGGLRWEAASSSGFWSLSRWDSKTLCRKRLKLREEKTLALTRPWHSSVTEFWTMVNYSWTLGNEGTVAPLIWERYVPSRCLKLQTVSNPTYSFSYTNMPMMLTLQIRQRKRLTIINDKIEQL